MGSEDPLTEALSTVTFITLSISGNSNIVFNNMFSKIDLKPLAASFFEIAFWLSQKSRHLEIPIQHSQIQKVFDIV